MACRLDGSKPFSETNYNEILIESDVFSFKKMHLKMSSGNLLQFCFGLNVFKYQSVWAKVDNLYHATWRSMIQEIRNFTVFGDILSEQFYWIIYLVLLYKSWLTIITPHELGIYQWQFLICKQRGLHTSDIVFFHQRSAHAVQSRRQHIR